MQNFQYLDHATDIIIEAYGKSIEEAFQNMAAGVVNVMFDITTVDADKTIQIIERGSDLKNLLYNWIEKILHVIFLENVVLSRFTISIKKDKNNESYLLEGKAQGEEIDLEKHMYKTEIKGVTYHEMQILEENNQYRIKALLDL